MGRPKSEKTTILPPPRGMDPVDHAMLVLACRWLPFGGAPHDDVFVEFGLTATEYVQRMAELVIRYRPHIHPETVERLLATYGAGYHIARSAESHAGASGT
jgi:hypothetical protein